MTDLIARAAAPTVYAPSPAKAELLADALNCIISGRPFPDGLCPPAAAPSAPATVRDGISRILRA